MHSDVNDNVAKIRNINHSKILFTYKYMAQLYICKYVMLLGHIGAVNMNINRKKTNMAAKLRIYVTVTLFSLNFYMGHRCLYVQDMKSF